MTRLKLLIVGASWLASAAHAQDTYITPDIPDEATKVWALKRAYQLNGNSMVGNNKMIDVSKEIFPLPVPVKTESIAPVPLPAERSVQVMTAETPTADVCARHHKRKVYTNDRKSWHCR